MGPPDPKYCAREFVLSHVQPEPNVQAPLGLLVKVPSVVSSLPSCAIEDAPSSVAEIVPRTESADSGDVVPIPRAPVNDDVAVLELKKAPVTVPPSSER